jgi:hypothetical protein
VDIDLGVELTELEKLEVTRVDAVGRPANGFPALIMKGITEPSAKADGDEKPAGVGRDAAKAAVREIIAKAADRKGNVDEAPDIQGGTEVIAMIADLIIAEAQELKAGCAGEICDIQQLACAAEMIWCWRSGEEAAGSGSVVPATAFMHSAAFEGDAEFAAFLNKAVEDYIAAKAGLAPWQYPADDVAKDSREFSAAERKKHAAEGNALPDGSYPIPDADALRRAAILARSGHGDVTAAKKLIARRAKELGVANPLDDSKDDDTAKSQIAPGGTDVDTVTQGSGDLAKAVADAVAKAVAPLKDELRLVSGELAKVKAQPVPGGPVLSRNVQVKQPGGVVSEDWAAKAAYYRDMAEQVTDRVTADGYRKLAREADAKAAPAAN